jgi:hypothetical protein
MAFALAFLIAVLIGLIITDAVTSTSWEEIERWKREDEDPEPLEDKDVIGNIWIPSQKALSAIKTEEENDE